MCIRDRFKIVKRITKNNLYALIATGEMCIRDREIVDDAKAKSKEIRTATNFYSDSILKTTEETLSSQLDIVKKTREKFSDCLLYTSRCV